MADLREGQMSETIRPATDERIAEIEHVNKYHAEIGATEHDIEEIATLIARIRADAERIRQLEANLHELMAALSFETRQIDAAEARAMRLTEALKVAANRLEDAGSLHYAAVARAALSVPDAQAGALRTALIQAAEHGLQKLESRLVGHWDDYEWIQLRRDCERWRTAVEAALEGEPK